MRLMLCANECRINSLQTVNLMWFVIIHDILSPQQTSGWPKFTGNQINSECDGNFWCKNFAINYVYIFICCYLIFIQFPPLCFSPEQNQKKKSPRWSAPCTFVCCEWICRHRKFVECDKSGSNRTIVRIDAEQGAKIICT